MTHYDDQLPKEALHILESTRNKHTNLPNLMRQGRYLPPNNDLMIDAIATLAMGKNVLLKGPTGAVKTKFAETLSKLFQQPMYSINCSVDLYAESLMGLKKIALYECIHMHDLLSGHDNKAMTL